MRQLRLKTTDARANSAEARSQAEHPSLQAFEAEFDYLMRTLRRLGVGAADLEDLAHEVFLVLYRTWEKYDPQRPLRAYLFGIAFRVAANHGRKRRREVVLPVMDFDDRAPGPERAFESSEARALVLMALERVPLPRRAVLLMHDIDQLPMAEIAANLGIRRFTGYSRLRKGRQELTAAVNALLRGAGPQ